MTIEVSKPRRIHLTRDGYIAPRSAGVGALPDAAYAYRGVGEPLYAVEVDGHTFEFRAPDYQRVLARIRRARAEAKDAGWAGLILRNEGFCKTKEG